MAARCSGTASAKYALQSPQVLKITLAAVSRKRRYNWGVARMGSCVEYIVHVDEDFRVVMHSSSASGGSLELRRSSWVEDTIEIMQQDSTIASVHPQRKGPDCRWDQSTDSCVCASKTLGNGSWQRYHFDGPLKVRMRGKSACAHLVTGHLRGLQHFSAQLFVAHAERFLSIWPYAERTQQIEQMIEAGMLQKRLRAVHLEPRELGVSKAEMGPL